MNFRIVLFIESILMMILSGFMFIITIISFFYGENDFYPLLISTSITFFSGLITFLLLRKRVNVNAMGEREGFSVVTFGWIFSAIFGALPYLIHGLMFPDGGFIMNFTDAFFEAMSGFTTTGSTILNDIEIFPHGLLLWRATTHWLGGMGIIVLALAILPKLGVSGYKMFKAEVPGPIPDKLTPKVSDTAKYLWFVYMGITLLEVIFLMFGGMNWFEAVTHSFATMATGGFSTLNGSVGGFHSAYIEWVVIVFMFLAGANFALHFSFITGNFVSHIKDSEFRLYAFIIVLSTGLITLWTRSLAGYQSIGEAIRHNTFQVVSIMTTTGFGTFDFELWPAQAQFLLVVLMFLGGCAGSTGGGVKILRIFLLFKFAKNELYKFIYPKRVRFIRYGKAVIPDKTVKSITSFFVIYISIFIIAVITTATLIRGDSAYESILTALSGCAATLNNIGPGLGIVGPTKTYASMPIAVKWIFSFLMLVGRLEVFSVLILLVPAGWRKGA